MPAWNIPEELALMLRQRRLIPFIGSGFSSLLGLPDWNNLLARVAKEIPAPLSFDQVTQDCQGDPLQIAEYYYLISDRSVGPLRFAIGKALETQQSPLSSGAHVELVNLGMPQIYTTNFDDLIEQTFHELNVPAKPVILPKDVASAAITSTQVVKYHGDLRHDKTLVLTESSYYERLDFESPMDLKFRSDLLGRSVLFMGYSFKDINIRVIWFKLMDMMKDIPVNERPTSFILRLNSNPALERLYEEVGIKTIVLDPQNKAASPEQKATLLNDFMFTIASLASSNGKIPGQKEKQQFFSAALADLLLTELEDSEQGPPPRFGRSTRSKRVPMTLYDMMETAGKRTIPAFLQEKVRQVLERCVISTKAKDRFLSRRTHIIQAVPLAISYSRAFGIDPLITFIVSLGLGQRPARETLLSDSVPWVNIWSAKLTDLQVNALLNKFEAEVVTHIENPGLGLDHDIAYLLDPVKRVSNAEMIDNPQLSQRANSLIQKAAEIYPSILAYTPTPDGPPKPVQVIQEIDERDAQANPPEGPSDDEPSP